MKNLGTGLGELDWNDDEAALRAKFPGARVVKGKSSVNPMTGKRTQLPDKVVIAGLVPGTEQPWEIELVDGRASLAVLLLEAPDDEDWHPVWDEMVAMITSLAEAHGFGPIELDADEPDQSWHHDGVVIDFRVEGESYILAIGPEV